MGGNAIAGPRHGAEESSALLSAARAIADHRELDWGRLETSAENFRQRGELRELRVIQAIARRHRALQSALEPAPAPLPAGRRLGDFELVAELGRGGMAIVYEAVQVPLGRRVALKVLPAGIAFSTASVNRFKREAHAAALLRHPNIVSIHATGEAQGCPFYAMELVEGPSLQAVLDAARTGRSREPVSTPLDPPGAEPGTRVWFETAARLVAGVADGLAAAHAQRIVHRDVKPGNLLFGSDGQLHLTDFGLARMLEEPGLTASGSFLGTPAYMSPEQIAGPSDRIDHRTDVYSLGAVLYELLTLSRPFPQESREAVACAILSEDATPPRRLQPEIPRDLEAICLKAIEKEPARRYDHAAAMAADLRSFLAREPIVARPLAPSRRLARHVRRHIVPT
ncbi:MAG: serine/threonine protein kinase, partial [Acidobacteria bacterium]|nr:serine/threonine protein kinase [Acidobacteriota bacterium]